MEKSAKAFRTIGEVATWLNTEAYVLRFWESRFSQIKPVKRKDGRRYYRPEDMKVIGGIKSLLHGEGLTIKGVQKILKERGVNYVTSRSPPIEYFVPTAEINLQNEKPDNTQNEILKDASEDQSEIKSMDDVRDISNVDDIIKSSQNSNKKKELTIILKRLIALRDRIQKETEDSFDN
jgi:DNA-binding transcriptional MerR regulator